MTLRSIGKVPISPYDFAMMQGVLMEWCVRHKVPLDSAESERQARQIISWFECGCCSEALLRDVFLPPPQGERH